jgi:hypothetical protein
LTAEGSLSAPRLSAGSDRAERSLSAASNLTSTVGGGTPTRASIYRLPAVEAARTPPSKMPNIPTTDAVFEAWKPENIGLRPKIAAWNGCDTAIFTQLSFRRIALPLGLPVRKWLVTGLTLGAVTGE